MALGDVAPFWEWVERDNPSYIEGTLVQEWIVAVGEAPWQAPSVPIPQLANQPDDEVRRAVVPDTNVEVIYRQTYATGVVDLIACSYLWLTTPRWRLILVTAPDDTITLRPAVAMTESEA